MLPGPEDVGIGRTHTHAHAHVHRENIYFSISFQKKKKKNAGQQSMTIPAGHILDKCRIAPGHGKHAFEINPLHTADGVVEKRGIGGNQKSQSLTITLKKHNN